MKNFIQDELWSEAAGEWADNKVKEYLDRNHEEYRNQWENSGKLCEECPVIDALVCGEGKISLTEEEHRLFIEYLDVKDILEQLEKEYHFYLGLVMTLPFEQACQKVQDKAEPSKKESSKENGKILDKYAEGCLESCINKFQSEKEKKLKERTQSGTKVEKLKKEDKCSLSKEPGASRVAIVIENGIINTVMATDPDIRVEFTELDRDYADSELCASVYHKLANDPELYSCSYFMDIPGYDQGKSKV